MYYKFMGGWDKFTAVFAIMLGLVFMILGAVGLFAGCAFNFNLPPVLGGLPFIFGWAMFVTLIKYWKVSNTFRKNHIFMCPRCQMVAPLIKLGDLQCPSCGLKLTMSDSK